MCNPLENGVRVLHEQMLAGRIIQATKREDGGRFTPIEGAYLLISFHHITELKHWLNLEDSIAWALRQLEISSDYNVSINIGTEAGQTIDHLHVWIIQRSADLPSSRMGLAQLIREKDQPT